MLLLLLCVSSFVNAVIAQELNVDVIGTASTFESASSHCLDYADFLNFKASYDFKKHIAAAPYFTTYIDNDHIDFSCRDLFLRNEIEAVWPPPTYAELELSNPKYLKDLTFNHEIRHIDFYTSSKHNDGDGFYWPADYIQNIVNMASQCGQYQQTHCETTFTKHRHRIDGKHGIILGTQVPWAEGAVLRQGAAKVTTIEYMPIGTDHPQLEIYTPDVANSKYLEGTLELADFIVSFSSLEHDGLGRYGDPLNAFGDLETMAKMHCLLKPDGVIFLGIPLGFDEVHFNAHRIYGYKRLSVVLALGFKIIDIVNDVPFRIEAANKWHTQPFLVLQKA